MKDCTWIFPSYECQTNATQDEIKGLILQAYHFFNKIEEMSCFLI